MTSEINPNQGKVLNRIGGRIADRLRRIREDDANRDIDEFGNRITKLNVGQAAELPLVTPELPADTKSEFVADQPVNHIDSHGRFERRQSRVDAARVAVLMREMRTR